MFGSRWHQLQVLDHLIDELARPCLADEGLSPSVSDQLRALGVPVDRSPRRKELIAELWGRKRPLVRQLYASHDPTLPCA